MKSIKLEYLRDDDLETGILQKNRRYFKVEGNDKPIKQVVTTIGQLDCIKKIAELEYKPSSSEQTIQKTIQELSDQIQNIFLGMSTLPGIPTQIDLVLNPSELGLLPFEVLLDEEKKPWFANPNLRIILTRRIRQEGLIAEKENWPIIPRVLFVYANPEYGKYPKVPNNEHLSLIKRHLQNWVKGDAEIDESILCQIENASLEDIRDKLLKADEDEKAFTHVHILAHGTMIVEDPGIPEDYEYGIALNSKLGKPTKVAEVKAVFESLRQKPFVVSYMVCDAGSFRNTLRSDKNLIQVTHQLGVPIVIGSQFPLTYFGSQIITDILYGGLFSGEDIRISLHRLRCNLYENKNQTWQDWFGLVTYVRLPEGYENYLYESRLARELRMLITDGITTDKFLYRQELQQNDIVQKQQMLKTRVENLKELEADAKALAKPGVNQENIGLIASAFKRIAELSFRENQLFETLNDVKALLKEAQQNYKKAANFNLSHHWSTVQYLSLTSILDGYPKDSYYWYAAFQAVLNDEQKDSGSKIWALGSKAELYLLAPHIQPAKKVEEISKCFKELRALSIGNDFPIDSTWRQFSRYLNWWTVENGYHALPNPISKQDLKELIDILKGEIS